MLDLKILLFKHSAFSASTLLVGHQEEHRVCKNEWWGASVFICLERGANDLHGPADATATPSSLGSQIG